MEKASKGKRGEIDSRRQKKKQKEKDGYVFRKAFETFWLVLKNETPLETYY